MKSVSMKKSATLAIAASVALAAPAAVQGKPDKPAKPDKPGKGVAYVFKGAYSGDGATVAVDHTNKHARDFDDQTVGFDFSAAKLSVADTNASGAPDLADVAVGDRVVVKAKLPKSDPGAQPFAAKQLVDQTNPAPDDA
jgi:hypothetical protein